MEPIESRGQPYLHVWEYLDYYVQHTSDSEQVKTEIWNIGSNP